MHSRVESSSPSAAVVCGHVWKRSLWIPGNDSAHFPRLSAVEVLKSGFERAEVNLSERPLLSRRQILRLVVIVRMLEKMNPALNNNKRLETVYKNRNNRNYSESVMSRSISDLCIASTRPAFTHYPKSGKSKIS